MLLSVLLPVVAKLMLISLLTITITVSLQQTAVLLVNDSLKSQILSGTRLHANRALAPNRQRQLNARAAEEVAARRGSSGVTGEQLEADRALRRDVVEVLTAHVHKIFNHDRTSTRHHFCSLDPTCTTGARDPPEVRCQSTPALQQQQLWAALPL